MNKHTNDGRISVTIRVHGRADNTKHFSIVEFADAITERAFTHNGERYTILGRVVDPAPMIGEVFLCSVVSEADAAPYVTVDDVSMLADLGRILTEHDRLVFSFVARVPVEGAGFVDVKLPVNADVMAQLSNECEITLGAQDYAVVDQEMVLAGGENVTVILTVEPVAFDEDEGLDAESQAIMDVLIDASIQNVVVHIGGEPPISYQLTALHIADILERKTWRDRGQDLKIERTSRNFDGELHLYVTPYHGMMKPPAQGKTYLEQGAELLAEWKAELNPASVTFMGTLDEAKLSPLYEQFRFVIDPLGNVWKRNTDGDWVLDTMRSKVMSSPKDSETEFATLRGMIEEMAEPWTQSVALDRLREFLARMDASAGFYKALRAVYAGGDFRVQGELCSSLSADIQFALDRLEAMAAELEIADALTAGDEAVEIDAIDASRQWKRTMRQRLPHVDFDAMILADPANAHPDEKMLKVFAESFTLGGEREQRIAGALFDVADEMAIMRCAFAQAARELQAGKVELVTAQRDAAEAKLEVYCVKDVMLTQSVRLAEVEDDLALRTRAVEELRRQLHEARQAERIYTGTVESLSAENTILSEGVTRLHQQVSDLDAKVYERDSEITGLKRKLFEAERSIANRDQSINVQANTIRDQRVEIMTLTQKGRADETNLRELGDRVTALNTVVTERDETIETYANATAQLKKDNRKLKRAAKTPALAVASEKDVMVTKGRR